MAYFEDLTPYEYAGCSRFVSQPDALNIGWLPNVGTFPVGDEPPVFAATLNKLVTQPVKLCRGWHTCPWCSENNATGNGEIRVTASDGTVYAAPVLIAHYVSAHHYRPPQVFIDAVLALAEPQK